MRIKIKKFVINVLNIRENKHSKLILRKVQNKEIYIIKELINIDINNYVHVIDSFGIKHILKTHGVLSEYKRGQIPVTINDFELIPDILKDFDTIEYGDKNKQGRHVIVYKKEIKQGMYFYVEEIRSPKKKECVIQTMYIRKK